VIIEDGSPQLESLLCWLDEIDGLACRAMRWKTLQEGMTQAYAADLLIAVSDSTLAVAHQMLAWLRDHPAPTPVLAVLPGDADDALVKLTGLAAEDFLLTPVRRSELCHRVLRLLRRQLRSDDPTAGRVGSRLGMEQLVGQGPAFLAATAAIPQIAASGFPVVITGETGTGKELCARAIHHLSSRRSYPFVAVDCSALPENLFENELFGHARGAYTDAHSDHRGLIAAAEGGTLLLDEIDSLTLASQAKLLRFLQEGTYKPLGFQGTVKANVHVIVASNTPPEDCVREQRFRSDLYYRLSVVQVILPPLRERGGDIELLAEDLLRNSPPPGTNPKSLTPAARAKLRLYEWPGNVRELSNVMQRAIWFSQGPDILPRDIILPGGTPDVRAGAESFRQARAEVLEAFERSYVAHLLRKHGGNVTRAAMEAGKERRAFGRLAKKHGHLGAVP